MNNFDSSDLTPSSDAPAGTADARITLGLLSAVEENSVVTQRSLSRDLGIALGLTNAYLRRCVTKGLIKVTQAPANRYAYYLTPKGFSEKSRLTAHYLSRSFDFFRRARGECEGLLGLCENAGWTRLALCGAGDLAEIALLCADGRSVEIVGLVDGEAAGTSFRRLPVVRRIADLPAIDAALLTDHRQPQRAFDAIVQDIAAERILAPRLLNISRRPPVAAEAE